MPRDNANRPATAANDIVTVCTGCYSDCAFCAHINDDGSVSARMPVEGHPHRSASLCRRGRRRLNAHLDPDRLLTPLVRDEVTGELVPTSYEEAYARIAQGIEQVVERYGAPALACTTGIASRASLYFHRLFAALGSPNVYSEVGACEDARLTGWYHTLGYSPHSDLAHTDYIVYLGRSPLDAGDPHTVNVFKETLARGGKVVAVDPRRSSTGAKATRWIRLRPGTDLAFLLGLAHILIEEELYDADFVSRYTTGFEEFACAMAPYTPEWCADTCGIEARDVLEVAHGLGAAKPRAVVDCGLHGGLGIAYVNSTQTARMIALVNALLGNYGKVGGNLNPPFELELGTLDPERFPAPPVPEVPKAGSLRYPLVNAEEGLCTTIGESIELGEIHGLVAYASNPVMGYGNARAWTELVGKLDLLVAIDVRMSETARLADVVLPDLTALECDRGVGVEGATFYTRKRVLTPPEGMRPARAMAYDLAERLGVGRYFTFTLHDLAQAQLAPYGVDLDELYDKGWVNTGIPVPPRTGEPEIRVPAGKIEFASNLWEEAGLGRCPFWQTPLICPDKEGFRLISGNSSFGNHTSVDHTARKHAPGSTAADAYAAVWMNADRAAELGFVDGDIVEVYSELGSDHAVLRVTEDLHPEALFTNASPGGRSGKHAARHTAVPGQLGVGPFDHTPLHRDPVTGCALTQENVVRVRKIES